MAKYSNFIVNLKMYLNRHSNTEIKRSIGDSIRNNRTLTVHQVIRSLTTSKRYSDRALGKDLLTVYTKLKPQMRSFRERGGNRTDAFDINEFIISFKLFTFVDDNKRVIGRLLF
jgi:hypothetical protein